MAAKHSKPHRMSFLARAGRWVRQNAPNAVLVVGATAPLALNGPNGYSPIGAAFGQGGGGSIPQRAEQGMSTLIGSYKENIEYPIAGYAGYKVLRWVVK